VPEELKRLIRTIPDYPKPGIQFRDVTTLLADGPGLRRAVDLIVDRHRDGSVTCVAGIEARGFIFGTAIAYELGVGFVPLRKTGKLPGETIGQEYSLEYGEDRIEMHVGAVKPGDRVLVIDDLIATGGTAEAAVKLIRQAGADITECCFVIDLPDLGGMKRLRDLGCETFALVEFEGD